MSEQPISDILSKQLYWLNTWKTKSGGYNGYVVHRHDLKRLFKIHDTPWSQAPIINGYINLYRITKQKSWLNNAIEAADLQAGRIQDDGSYIYAGFEDDRFSSLVHNSLANCSLLDLAKLLKEEGLDEKAQHYIMTVTKNVDHYLIRILWDEQFGAFKFSKIDYYTPNQVRFVVNMNSVAAECLIKLSEMTGKHQYKDMAIRIGEWILTEQQFSDDVEDGGINYSQIQPRILVSIYTALSIRGLDDLYHQTKDTRYLKMIDKAATHLVKMIDPDTLLFYHGMENGIIKKYPQFIAGSGIILLALDDAENICGKTYNYDNVTNNILKSQLTNGGFPNFFGYRKNQGISCEVWEDVAPVVGWNAHLFEYLTRKADKKILSDLKKMKSWNLIKKGFYFHDGPSVVFIVSIFPLNSIVLLLIVKKFNYSILSISSTEIYKNFKRGEIS